MLVYIGICSALVPIHLPQHHLVGRYLVVVVPSTYYYVAWIRVAIINGFPRFTEFYYDYFINLYFIQSHIYGSTKEVNKSKLLCLIYNVFPDVIVL